MFTGIIEAQGHISAIDKKELDISLTITSNELDFSDIKIGDSIATNGVCLTVVNLTSNSYRVDLSTETLANSAFQDYKIGHRVNLEKAMLANTRFGGHIVSGHVDGIATVVKYQACGRAHEYWLETPQSLAKYIAPKGSITIDGISLTVNDVCDNRFKLTIIPHTLAKTSIANYKIGTKVNIEVDIIARYLERLVNYKPTSSPESKVTMELLAKSGFIG